MRKVVCIHGSSDHLIGGSTVTNDIEGALHRVERFCRAS